jgi:hypothetical protein
VFRAIFVRDDMIEDQAGSIKANPKYAEEQLVAAGFA